MNTKIVFSKALLQDALIEILQKKELSFITVKEVTDWAGLHRSTFYSHYKNTSEVMDDIIEKEMSQIVIKINPSQQSIYEYGSVIKYIFSNKKKFLVLLKFGHYEKYINGKIQEEISSDYLVQKNIDISYFNLINSFFISGLKNYLIYYLEHENEYSINEISEIIFSLSIKTSNLIRNYST